MASGFFDPVFYKAQNPAVASANADPLLHYMDHGAGNGLDPSAVFNTAYYVRCNPDIVAAGVNPLVHFVRYGRFEGRLPRPLTAAAGVLGDWTPPVRESAQAETPSPQVRPIGRYVIYTAIVGGYDRLEPLEFRPPDCDLVVFSDRPMTVEGWQVRPLNYLHPDPTRSARFAKLHPHFFFPDYEYSVWIDGNIGVRGDIRPLMERLNEKSFLGIFEHPLRNCIYAEGEECIRSKRDDPRTIKDQLASYRLEGFPEAAGLWETNVLVRRHNKPGCIALMSAWWRELELGSARDQISLPVVARRNGATVVSLGDLGISVRDHPLLSTRPHQLLERTTAAETGWPKVAKRISATIGICVHNRPAETQQCLESALSARRPQDRIVIVDDASDAATADLLDGIAAKNERVDLIRHHQNQGYTRSANAVLRAANTDWIILVNSDAIMPKDSIRKLISCGEQFPCLGIVGPLSNAASWQSVPSPIYAGGNVRINDLPKGVTVDTMDRLCQEAANGLVPFVPLVNGFCFAIRRAVVECIGLFDDESFPIGYGEEDDFCLRAADGGYICGIAIDTYVYHVKSASFTSERRKKLAEAGGIALREKHTAERVASAVQMLLNNPELRRVRDRVAERLEAISLQEAI
jgi:GT2 family glycosyltransferase